MPARARRQSMLALSVLAGGFASAAVPESPPAGVRLAVSPRFPAEARATGHSDGSATLATSVAADGQVLDVVTLQATHRAFGAAAEEAVLQWQFEPRSAPTQPRREVLEFEFRSKGVVTVLTHAEAARENVVPLGQEFAVRSVQWSEIASPPQRIAGSLPKLSSDIARRLGSKPVLASFVIDTHGEVHVPVVDADTDPEAAQAVIEALRGWRFAPAQVDGQAVVIQAQRAFQGSENMR
jgi:TonB family protein